MIRLHVMPRFSVIPRMVLRSFVSIARPLFLMVFAACSASDLVGTAKFPSNLNDPRGVETPEGAIAAYNGTLVRFRKAFGGDVPSDVPDQTLGYVLISARITDEFLDPAHLGGVGGLGSEQAMQGLDSRNLPEYTTTRLDESADDNYGSVYQALQQVRGQALQAIGMLTEYAPDASPALRGHLYSILGYSELMLAELFCSGVPLSTLDYKGDYTLSRGVSTNDIFRHARALFDTAATLSTDSLSFVRLAHLGSARALLALGQFDSAASMVHDIPDGYQYAVQYSALSSTGAMNFGKLATCSTCALRSSAVADMEGINGLPYRSSGDPRTSAASYAQSDRGVTLYRAQKYAIDGSSPIVLADWIEARLIEAEADLKAGRTGPWFETINHLRRTAITPALVDTTDPGTPAGRVNLHFRERAFWLFLTGHRQGDLRRMIRYYGRTQQQVYPTGTYQFVIPYGTQVTAPIPGIERERNPLFKGCINRGA